MRYRRATFVAAISVLSGCGNEAGAPTPPVNQVRRVELTPLQPLVFLGDRRAWTRFLTVRNAADTAIRGWHVTGATVPFGFISTPDSLFAPQREALGPLHAAATTLATASPQDPAANGEIRAVFDLRTRAFTATFTCKPNAAVPTAYGVPFDSVRYSGAIWVYYSDRSPMVSIAGATGIGEIVWQGTATVWRGGSIVLQRREYFSPIYWIRSQLPGRVNVIPPTGAVGSYWLDPDDLSNPAKYVQLDPRASPCNPADEAAPFTMVVSP